MRTVTISGNMVSDMDTQLSLIANRKLGGRTVTASEAMAIIDRTLASGKDFKDDLFVKKSTAAEYEAIMNKVANVKSEHSLYIVVG